MVLVLDVNSTAYNHEPQACHRPVYKYVACVRAGCSDASGRRAEKEVMQNDCRPSLAGFVTGTVLVARRIWVDFSIYSILPIINDLTEY